MFDVEVIVIGIFFRNGTFKGRLMLTTTLTMFPGSFVPALAPVQGGVVQTVWPLAFTLTLHQVAEAVRLPAYGKPRLFT